MTFARNFAAIMVLIPMLAGCGGSENTFPGPDPTTLSMSSQASNGLQATLTQDKASVTHSESPMYTFSVTNTSAAPVMLRAYAGVDTQGNAILSTAQRFSPSQSKTYGSTVYPAPGSVTPAIARETFLVSLPSGYTIRDKYGIGSDTLGSGRYQATADFTMTGADSESTQHVMVGPLTVSVH